MTTPSSRSRTGSSARGSGASTLRTALATAANFGDAKNSHGAFEMVGLGTDADGGAPFVLLSGVRARPAADEMWFKSYGNVPNGRAFVSRFPASAFASTGVPPTAAAAAWTVGFDDGAADNAARYATAKAARAPASLNGRVAWAESLRARASHR